MSWKFQLSILKNKNVLCPKKYLISQEWTGFNIKTTSFINCLNFQWRFSSYIFKLIKTHTSKTKYKGFAKILSNMIAHHYWDEIQVFQYLTSLKSCGKALKSKRHTCCCSQFSVAALFVGFLAKRRRFSVKIRVQKLYKYLLV